MNSNNLAGDHTGGPRRAASVRPDLGTTGAAISVRTADTPLFVHTCHPFSQVAAYHHGVVERGDPGDSDYTGDIVTGGATSESADERIASDSGPDHDYLLNDVPQGHPVGIAWSETEWGHPERQPEPTPSDGRFDAFNASTWNFKPAPPPWYDSTQAKLAIAAVSLAAVALVVSIVLLLFQGSSGEDSEPSPTTTTAPTTTTVSSEAPPPPPPPPPPTSQTPEQAPVIVRPRQPTRQSNKPEIGVTRTPVTRSPISVSPQRPGANR
jgi:hypothetical protein